MNIVVLGGGRVGHAMVLDLAGCGHAVTLADIDSDALAKLADFPGVATVRADLGDPAELARVVAPAELVVGAVPGFMGFETVRRVLLEGKPVVDISFFPEDAMELDTIAREAGVPCLVDCGVAPGLSNLVLGRMEAALDETHRFECLVGGLPVLRTLPYEYKAPFSPIDVLEEYTRPARFRIDGHEVVFPALSDVELVDIPGVGTLEAFNTDGVRSLLRTCSTPTMVEKTMRYPGHADLMRTFRETGLFSTEAVDTPSGPVVPLDLTAKLLFRAWKYDEGEEDLTAMRITVEGVDGGKSVRHVFHLLDRYDPVTRISSMARTTGYTCTAMVALVASGTWKEPGVAPPEFVGRREDCFDAILAYLSERGVHFGPQG
ncbi:MAG: saccharopine dehydrogenase NADP-binding domain-containing protein [Gemmatimonadota bacterium]|nr:saccharopine dehydrogenase NADP-binding domain-containing protein [Gemmatimonadota bacterium]MDH5758881.1 saccharopine dehydrogenase NADP-binding domain-containing protein [Gemmatimonadota bacterium]